jgi:hypothetical protein
MSVMSSLRRSVYGVPSPEMRATKFRFFRKVDAERGDVKRRASEILRREIERKEARRAEVTV